MTHEEDSVGLKQPFGGVFGRGGRFESDSKDLRRMLEDDSQITRLHTRRKEFRMRREGQRWMQQN